MQNATAHHSLYNADAYADPLQYVIVAQNTDMMSAAHDALIAGRGQLRFQRVVTVGAPDQAAFHTGLLCLHDPLGQMIPALYVSALGEDAAAARIMDCVTLDLALRTLREKSDLRLSIKVSARAIADGEWRHILNAALYDNVTIGERLILEIDETSAMLLHDAVVRFMHDMQPKGIGFALGGFGAGLIAFRQFKDFFFDLVVVDKSFVRGIHHNIDNQVLVEALLGVAHHFEMMTVADGVDTNQDAAFLKDIGVQCLQGTLFT